MKMNTADLIAERDEKEGKGCSLLSFHLEPVLRLRLDRIRIISSVVWAHDPLKVKARELREMSAKSETKRLLRGVGGRRSGRELQGSRWGGSLKHAGGVERFKGGLL